MDAFLLDLGVMGGKLVVMVVLGAGSGLIKGENFALELFLIDLSSSWDISYSSSSFSFFLLSLSLSLCVF